MHNKLMKILSVVSFITAGCGASEAECFSFFPPKSNGGAWFPYNAYYVNNIGGELGAVVDTTIEDLESRTGESFMHSAPVADMDVKIVYGDLENDAIGLATTWSNHCVITMSNKLSRDSRWDSDDFAGVLRHEIGHCFGIDHSDDTNSIMYYQYIPWIHLRERAIGSFVKDLKEFRDSHRRS